MFRINLDLIMYKFNTVSSAIMHVLLKWTDYNVADD